MNFCGDLALQCLESSPCGYLVVAEDGTIFFWNRWLEQTSGRRAAQLCGQPLLEAFPQLDNSRLSEAVTLALTQGLPSILTPKLNVSPLPLYRRDATVEKSFFPQLIRVLAVKNCEQRRFCLVQVDDVSGAFHREQQLRRQARDLEEQKNALGESEARFRSLFAASPVGLLIADGADLALRLCNDKFRHLCGIDPQAVLGNLYDFLPAHGDRQALRDYAAQAAKPAMFTVRLDSAGHGWGLLSLSPCTMDGEPVLIGGLLDITRRVNAELAATSARRDAEKANAAKSTFLANMSHEIRTPLNAVIGLAHIVLGELPAGAVRDNLEKIEQSGQLLLALVNDILDFSKIEANKLELELASCDVDVLCGYLIDAFSAQLAAKGLLFSCRVAPQLPRCIDTDALRLQQILNNLLSNALKFTVSGQVELQVDWSVEQGKSILIFKVIDSGIGMDAAEQQRLFQPFSQVDPSTSRSYGGTGLGLAISRRLSQLFGGTLEVESRKGQGSTFELRLPATASESQQLPLPVELRGVAMVGWQLSPAQQQLTTRALRAWGRCCALPQTTAELAAELLEAGAETTLLITSAQGRLFLDTLDGLSARCFCRVVFEEAGATPAADGVPAVLSASQLRTVLLTRWRTQRGLAVNSAPAAMPATVQARELSGLTLLVVEDNIVNQLVARAILERYGSAVVVVSSGNEALELLADTHNCPAIDAILMDVQMPGLDGYETTRRLRAAPHHYQGPIIALTAHAMAEERQRCLLAGMNDHVTKPIQPQLLCKTIRAHFGGGQRQAVTCAAVPAATNDTRISSDSTSWQAASGLARLAEDAPLFRSLVQQFMDNYSPGLFDGEAWLGQSAAQQQFWLHNLKGVAATLGAQQLARKAARLEAALVNGDAAHANRTLWQGLAAELQQVNAAMRQWCAAQTAAPWPCAAAEVPAPAAGTEMRTKTETEVDGAALPALVLELRQQLLAKDLEALASGRRLLQQWPQNSSVEADNLQRALENLNFKTALTALQQLCVEQSLELETK